MHIIQFKESTMELITELNNGVRPETTIENPFFIWYGPGSSEIKTQEEVIDFVYLYAEQFVITVLPD